MMAYGLMLKPEVTPILSESEDESVTSLMAGESSNDLGAEKSQDQAVNITLQDKVYDEPSLSAPLMADAAVEETKLQRYWRCTKLVFWQALNLLLVYFFEYVISVGAADKAEAPNSTHSLDWFIRNAFVLLAFSYQLGVFVSRSSLKIMRIKRVEILTIIQAANFVLWLLHAYYKFLPIAAQIPLMIFVGLLGGASYVNVFYNLLNDDIYPDKDRELIVNMAAVCINLGIVLASVFIIVMDATFLLHK
jgi:battenin